MKRLLLAGVMASAIVASLPLSAQQPPPGKDAKAQTAPDVKAFDRQLVAAQAQFKRMQEEMDRLRQAQDPQERQRLMQEHWTSMQAAMATMRGMWGPGAMGCCAGGTGMMGPGMMGGHGMMGRGGMQPYYSKLTPEQMKQRQYMMDQYMGMQQMMMDQMMQRQQWMMQPGPTAPTK